MDSFLLPLIATFLISLGGRDQLTVARLAERLGPAPGLLAAGALVSTATAALMATAGLTVAELLPSAAKQMLVAFALLAAAIELFWPVRMKAPTEPTRSLGAIALALFFRQIGDGARFAIFAFAAATVLAPMAAIGGALGGFAALLLGWMMRGELERRLPLRGIRIALGGALAIAAIVLALSARALL
ncbi:hypothetical protein P7228_09365 [Altererythrobacter arenosus]|uniref:GDT1 family protein n=1 Tax=Altererythrobacter arenosus TaxID=3032592 RepID=A0ABY8FMH9_9SPHN|nr:hypothetical protein [Altererythrobacter sp. CAU 1644]WFL76208.1 hypothetical protein P7228_09365 [Altererythrobacter sp. CAU 1644]